MKTAADVLDETLGVLDPVEKELKSAKTKVYLKSSKTCFLQAASGWILSLGLPIDFSFAHMASPPW